MKTLFLVRHAKSSRDDATQLDKDRPLDGRGTRDASKMGKRLGKRGVKPDLIVSSPARRALATAQSMATELHYKLDDIVVDDGLYAGAASDLLGVVRNLDDKRKSVMLVGHNPAISELACALSPTIAPLPTCAVVQLRLKATSWSDVGTAQVVGVKLDFPKKEAAG